MMQSRSTGAGPMQERISAWWLEVLTRRRASDHPLYGNSVRARLVGDTLRVSGSVESEEARLELKDETQALLAEGVADVDFRVGLSTAPERRCVLRQAVLSFFTTIQQAELARRLLDGVPDIHPFRSFVASVDDFDLQMVTEAWQEKVVGELGKAPGLLVLELDEVDVFRAKALLEETKSVQTLVLPPESVDEALQCKIWPVTRPR